MLYRRHNIEDTSISVPSRSFLASKMPLGILTGVNGAPSPTVSRFNVTYLGTARGKSDGSCRMMSAVGAERKV